jgi:hypothetical protein
MVFSERYHNPGVEGFLLSSGLDIDLEWNCPSLSGSSWRKKALICNIILGLI